MPVMIKSNEATELCITKGQEGIVVDWDSSIGPDNRKILNNLFVELVNPPRPVQIPGLPINVVPMSRTSRHVTALLQDDSLLSINRDQVLVLPNFSMTDYSSQGKSRDPNVVHLNNCRDHRAYYVALSRGHRAQTTVIVQGFEEKKITKGLSGYLRQEFRELEMLDEITRLRYEGHLPTEVRGVYRKNLLRSYISWKGPQKKLDPAHFHPAIRYNSKLDENEEAVEYGEWEATIKKKKPSAKKRKPEGEIEIQPTKKINASSGPVSAPPPPLAERQPLGLIWDSLNYSCSYNALFTCLMGVLDSDSDRWTKIMMECSALLGVWVMSMKETPETPERARNLVREVLNDASPVDFPYGPIPIGLDGLFRAVSDRATYGVSTTFCEACTYKEHGVSNTFGQVQEIGIGRRLK
ncbi:hypothetical protein K438DRAFT_1607274 [Mycena galopus ATCC 62051]|nr:hypothetical protein K438DRAFT_1607274 [Mycena galopus ATCC 62051]